MTTPDYTGRNIVVVGAGVSGVEAARFLLAHGARVTLSDGRPLDKLPAAVASLQAQGVTIEAGGTGLKPFSTRMRLSSVRASHRRWRTFNKRGRPAFPSSERLSWHFATYAAELSA